MTIEKQLEIEQQQNEMLIETLEQYKSDYVVLEEQFKRLQTNVVVYQDELVLYQEFTQWLEENLSSEQDRMLPFTVQDFYERIMTKVHKLNHD